MLSSEKRKQNTMVPDPSSRTHSQASDLNELLPHDKMAEQAVLGAIIIQNSVLLQILDILTSDDFFSP
ncbi:MAG TPA: DNA helicase, partial [Deltaproteobacteria bacterium]|nr:DNA helicase [Deltaproteobacteria bacterium]